MGNYDRYARFRLNNDTGLVPFIEIPKRSSDFYEVYQKNKTRLDILSYKYYKDPNFAWLILQANPEVATIEYDIPDNTIIRIPYPLEETLRRYDECLEEKLNEK